MRSIDGAFLVRPMPRRDWLTPQWQLLRPYARYAYYQFFPKRRPDYFRKAWTYPGSRLSASSPYLPDAGKPVYFFLPMCDWHSRMQRSQHLATAIAKSGCQSVYVNPHLGLEYARPYGLDPHTRIAQIAPGVFELHIHLPREHELHTRPLLPAESARVTGGLSRLIQAAGIRQGALVVSFPAWTSSAEALRARHGLPIVYDCHDWLPGFGRIAPALLEQESDLFRLADLVVFSSSLLEQLALERHGALRRTVLLRNAVPSFAPAARPVSPSPPRPKTIGYIGSLDHWFDVDAVADIARDHPEWRVVLAGRVEDRRVLQLESFSNVMFAGEIPYSAVPAQLEKWDVAMIPFLVNDLTLATNPIKLYEYFSFGLPVVSSRLPEVELYGNLVYLASAPHEFSAMSAAAMREQDAGLREQRIRTALQETWDVRAERLLASIAVLT